MRRRNPDPSRRRRPPWWLVIAALAVAGLAVLPLAYLFVRVLDAEPGALADVLFTRQIAELLSRTLGLVAGVLALATALALPMAWLVTRTDLPGRRLWAVAGALPLIFPSYVAAFSLVAIAGPRGLAQRLLAVERLPDFAYGYSGALLVLGFFTYPYLYLLIVAALRDLDPALEESSRGLGVGRWGTFFQVVLPQLRPALLAGLVLVGLYTLSDFGAVSIVRYNTFTLAIFNAYQGLFDRAAAAALAAVLALVSLAFLGVEALLLRRLRPHRVRPVRAAPPVALGRWRLPATLGLGTIATINLGLPLATVGTWAAQGLAVGNPLGGAGRAAFHSLEVAALAAGATVVLAVPVVVWAVRYPSPTARLAERLAHAGYALPGLVVALSLVFFAIRVARPLYQTLALLLAAYVVRFLPEALAATRASLVALSPRFEEAARGLGRGPLSVLGSLTLPLIRPGLLAGAGLVFLTTMKELPATLILRPTGFETLATRIWATAAEGIYSQAAVPALWLVALSAPPVYALVIRPALAPRRQPVAVEGGA